MRATHCLSMDYQRNTFAEKEGLGTADTHESTNEYVFGLTTDRTATRAAPANGSLIRIYYCYALTNLSSPVFSIVCYSSYSYNSFYSYYSYYSFYRLYSSL